MRGREAMGGRHPTPALTETTGSFATAFEHIPVGVGGPDHHVAEIDISRQGGGRVSSCVPQLTEEEAGQAATFASADGIAYVFWLCGTHGHIVYVPLPCARAAGVYRVSKLQVSTADASGNGDLPATAGRR